MPIVFLLAGLMLIITALNNKMPQLGSLIKADFQPSQGDPGFVPWIITIFVIGALGYVKALKPISIAFLTLIVVVIFLSNGGFFDKFSSAIEGDA